MPRFSVTIEEKATGRTVRETVFAKSAMQAERVMLGTKSNPERLGRYARSAYDLVEVEEMECRGHEPGPYEPMGISVYCDGSCR